MVTSTQLSRRRLDAVDRLFVLLCCCPLLVLAAVYLEALAASLALHHWPIPSLDDPKSIPTAPLHLVNTPLVFGLFPVALVTFAIAVANWRMLLRSSFYRSWLSINVLGIVLHLVLAYTDPGQVWNWWLD